LLLLPQGRKMAADSTKALTWGPSV